MSTVQSKVQCIGAKYNILLLNQQTACIHWLNICENVLCIQNKFNKHDTPQMKEDVRLFQNVRISIFILPFFLKKAIILKYCIVEQDASPKNVREIIWHVFLYQVLQNFLFIFFYFFYLQK